MPNRDEFNAFLNGRYISYPGSLETNEFILYARSVLSPAFIDIYNCTDIAQLKSLQDGLYVTPLTLEAQAALNYGGECLQTCSKALC